MKEVRFRAMALKQKEKGNKQNTGEGCDAVRNDYIIIRNKQYQSFNDDDNGGIVGGRDNS